MEPANSPHKQRPYAVVAHVGGKPAVEASRTVDISPRVLDGDSDDHPAVQALRAADLAPADVRARVLVYIDPAAQPADAVASYAALCAYAGRRLDVQVGEGAEPLDGPALDAASRAVPDPGRPDTVPDTIQFGASHPTLPSVVGAVGVREAELVRYARRVRLVLIPDCGAAIAQFLAVAALRSRSGQDRFPQIVFDPALGAEDDDTHGVDLDAVRRAAIEVRRQTRSDDRSALAPRGQLTSRQKDLLTAAATRVEAVMVALGSTTPGAGVWHCPRPHRHTHGDAIPSMRVEESRARCFRCDPEWVDSLRLTADVKGWSFDDAADWLTKVIAPKVEELVAVVADRLPVPSEAPSGEDSQTAE